MIDAAGHAKRLIVDEMHSEPAGACIGTFVGACDLGVEEILQLEGSRCLPRGGVARDEDQLRVYLSVQYFNVRCQGVRGRQTGMAVCYYLLPSTIVLESSLGVERRENIKVGLIATNCNCNDQSDDGISHSPAPSASLGTIIYLQSIYAAYLPALFSALFPVLRPVVYYSCPACFPSLLFFPAFCLSARSETL